MTSPIRRNLPSLPTLFLSSFPNMFFFCTRLKILQNTKATGGAVAYVPARIEIHELLNISVNLYVDTNRALPDELYIAHANRKRPMSEINVRSKVWPQLGMRHVGTRDSASERRPDIKFRFMANREPKRSGHKHDDGSVSVPVTNSISSGKETFCRRVAKKAIKPLMLIEEFSVRVC